MKNFFCKYKYLLVAVVAAVITVTLLILFFSGGPKRELKKLIDQVNGYSAKEYSTALSEAIKIYENEEASDEDIESAITILKKAVISFERDASSSYYYDAVSVPGVQKWTEEDCVMHNVFSLSEISISKKCLIGEAQQSVAAKSANSNTFWIANANVTSSTIGGALFGDIFDGFHSELGTYDGIRIAITDKHGLYPEFPKDGVFELSLYGDPTLGGALPRFTATCKADKLNLFGGYILIPFSEMVSSWDENESFATIPYSTWYNGYTAFSVKLSGSKISKLNNGKLYISDFQLYTQKEIVPRDELESLISEAISLDKNKLFESKIDEIQTVCDNIGASKHSIDDAVIKIKEILLNLKNTDGVFNPNEIIANIGAVSPLHAEKNTNEVKLLMIGNSFSVNAYNYIQQIAKAEGVALTVANLNYGGCSLERHYSFFKNDSAVYGYSNSWGETKHEYTISEALADQDWDYISIQQVSGYSGLYDTAYQPYLHEIVTFLREREPGAEIIWHQTWAYQKTSDHSDFPKYDRNQDKMWTAIESSSKKAFEAEDLSFIVPSGKAFQIVRSTSIGDNLNSDGYHANKLGEYIAGYCFFSTVTGKLPSENAYKLDGVSDEDTKLMTDAVTQAVLEYGRANYSKSSAYYKLLRKFTSLPFISLDAVAAIGDTSSTELSAFVSTTKALMHDRSVVSSIGKNDVSFLSEQGYSQFFNGTPDSETFENRHVTVGGVHLIALNLESGNDAYSAKTIAWLDSELAKIETAYPVFVATAVPVAEGSEISTVFKKYESIVSLSGYDGETLQKLDGFTAFNVGDLTSNDATASLISVDKNGNVRFRVVSVSGNEQWYHISSK